MYCKCVNNELYRGSFHIGRTYRCYWDNPEHSRMRIMLDWLSVKKIVSREYFFRNFVIVKD